MRNGTKWWILLVVIVCVLVGIGYRASLSLGPEAPFRPMASSTANDQAPVTATGTESTATNYVGIFTYAGEPVAVAYPNPITRLVNSAFLVAYDEQRENPAWAAYRIPGERKFGPLPRPRRFSTDARTQARVSHDDYTNSGFDRGHMVPNLAIISRFGEAAQAETFLMSNIAPQAPALNQGPWRLLEETLAETTAVRCTDIWVIIGPVYEGPAQKLPSGSVIPSAFFMLVADETTQGPRLQAFIMPQTAARGDDFRSYRTTVQIVQAKTGLDFFSELPDLIENRLEADKGTYWLED